MQESGKRRLTDRMVSRRGPHENVSPSLRPFFVRGNGLRGNENLSEKSAIGSLSRIMGVGAAWHAVEVYRTMALYWGLCLSAADG